MTSTGDSAMSMVTTPTAALAAGLGRYLTGKPCSKGHYAERFAKNRECVSCALERSARDPRKAERTKASAARNHKKRGEAQKKRYHSDPAHFAEINRRYRATNRDSVLEREALWRDQNRAKINAYALNRYQTDKNAIRAASTKWAKANPDKVAARTARRKAALLKATPAWANKAAIEKVYEAAATATRNTGVQYSVDHIIPLRGETVCGLHCEANLQVLTLSENSRKKNKLIDAALAEGPQ
jgi:hypothetical protein